MGPGNLVTDSYWLSLKLKPKGLAKVITLDLAGDFRAIRSPPSKIFPDSKMNPLTPPTFKFDYFSIMIRDKFYSLHKLKVDVSKIGVTDASNL